MESSTDSTPDPFAVIQQLVEPPPPHVFEAPELPPPHLEEVGVFARHDGVPGHRQEALGKAGILSVGGGGLMGMQSLALVRSGARWLTIVEPDRVERHNLPRQFFIREDVGDWKAFALARNLLPQSTNAVVITAIPLPFEEAVRRYPLSTDIVLCGVDNNRCRLAVAGFARERGIPAIFTMLSRDGTRFQAFLQGPYPTDPCLLCAIPDLNPDIAAPCAAATIVSCFLAAAHGVFFACRALMGWPLAVSAFNWREGDLQGVAPDRTGTVTQRPGCPLCQRR